METSVAADFDIQVEMKDFCEGDWWLAYLLLVRHHTHIHIGTITGKFDTKRAFTFVVERPQGGAKGCVHDSRGHIGFDFEALNFLDECSAEEALRTLADTIWENVCVAYTHALARNDTRTMDALLKFQDRHSASIRRFMHPV
ncbi:hypothetical protein A3C89_01085 [Candidatus Kaiserbacteria bacterium RIFCSPHIGHO2_02_FULL_50_50]|uniref:Uncharacterized protein n=1 Tax=Candidatus Kaiserbacteria bacterium RIFCSPHIGHO2_02_FULL_50_50 TaxID=1798492 RepID=A0A1F6DDT5_9BACT|nr:MAG: hypothetical protein A3C89_01085 [Candidatus Kaiserbacteria bacterium RIFCSPHIGHO2_02_FULL_50_50]OGG88716.1 MAG: hypothetical protein A3G62_00485 [Candidatus Kaiserbacteria bacterium RIFCSPLOWO2_12_FULL_50_10]